MLTAPASRPNSAERRASVRMQTSLTEDQRALRLGSAPKPDALRLLGSVLRLNGGGGVAMVAALSPTTEKRHWASKSLHHSRLHGKRHPQSSGN